MCVVDKQTQTPLFWGPAEKPPFALYGHRYNEKQTSDKKTYNVRAAKQVRVISLVSL